MRLVTGRSWPPQREGSEIPSFEPVNQMPSHLHAGVSSVDFL